MRYVVSVDHNRRKFEVEGLGKVNTIELLHEGGCLFFAKGFRDLDDEFSAPDELLATVVGFSSSL